MRISSWTVEFTARSDPPASGCTARNGLLAVLSRIDAASNASGGAPGTAGDCGNDVVEMATIRIAASSGARHIARNSTPRVAPLTRCPRSERRGRTEGTDGGDGENGLTRRN